MTRKTRWIQSTIEAAAACTHPMPWQRGTRRAQMIARRADLKLQKVVYAKSA